jgi:hypothetical protein
MKKMIQSLTITIVACVCMFNANANNMQKIDHLNVHYMAIGATFLTPEVAKAYNITRSRYNGLINIAVLDNTLEGTPAKHVSLTGKARNDLGQIKTLAFEEVTEGKAVYYLAQIKYSDEETFYFDININDGTGNKTLSFKQKFYVD